MIKTTLGQVNSALGVLTTLSKEKLSAKTAYAVYKLITLIAKDAEHLESKRVELVKEFGAEDDSGGFKVKDECLESFRTKLMELLGLPVEIEWRPLKVSELTVPISAGELAALGPFLEDDSE